MAQYGNKTSKNPPWARTDQSGMGMTANQMQQSMMNVAAALPSAAMLQYPQQQMFQGQIGYQQQLGNMYGTVQYPTRALNSAAFQNTSNSGVQQNQNRSGDSSKERVITGTVTKLQDNFGFVDDDIFFQLSCVTNGVNSLKIGSRVLVEATFNPLMPFKWNAQRIQVLPTNANQNQQRSNYSAVPPPNKNDNSGDRFNNRYNRNQQQNKNKQQQHHHQQQMQQARRPLDRARDRSLSVDSDRKRRKNDRRRSTSRDRKSRSRSRSPARKKRRAFVPRYNVQIPKFTLNNFENDTVDLKRKFTNMYIPSDFFMSRSIWQDSFPVDRPFNLDVPCKFHVFSKEVPQFQKPAPEPSDVDYLYSAKVILFASPGLEELFKKCITLADDTSRSESQSPEEETVLPAKLIGLLIGQRGKEPMAIGGPWSPSADGEDPESDPGVLIKTAIRTTKHQTGIDLSNCTHWFRFLEMHYRRSESVVKGKAVNARVETVVLFVPDIWSCVPTRPEWEDLSQAYAKQLHRLLTPCDESDEKKEEENEGNEEEDDDCEISKKEPTHYSELDPKNMKVSDLRDELEARGLSPKGLKTQLVARLSKVIKSEADAEEQKEDDKDKLGEEELDFDEKPDEEDHEKEEDKDKPKEEEKTELDEKEKARLEKMYKLPENPQIIVHPNPEFKSGKFNCTVASLHSLLNYRVEDNKEHSFELFLFAEMFNFMLTRDFSIHIYRALYPAADKLKEETKEKEEKEKEKKKAKETKEKDDKDKKVDDKDKKVDDKDKKVDDKDKKVDDKDKKVDKEKKNEEEDKKDKEEEEDKDDVESVHSRDKKEEKKKEKSKPKTVDPYLLLAFAYFDNTLCGYIVDRDLEDILTNLCLSFSRAQIKKLVQKVVTKDALHYRRLTDQSKEDLEETPYELLDFKTLLSQANRKMLPSLGGQVAKTKAEKLDSGFVMFNGSLIDVGKLMEQLERNEASRLNTEKLYNRLVDEHNSLKKNYDASDKNVKDLSMELSSYKTRLSLSNNGLDIMSARVMRYVDVIFQIKKHIDPIVKENTPEEEQKPIPIKPEIKEEELGSPKKDKLKDRDVKSDKKEQHDDTQKSKKEEKPLDEKTEEDNSDDDVKEIVEIKDDEKSKPEVHEMEVEESQVSNGENDEKEVEEVPTKEGQEGAKPEQKRKGALKEEAGGKRTPMKRDVKKETAATPATPKRKRI